MLFNSIHFLVFFWTVFILYWIIPSRKRTYLLLVASYFFYMSWSPLYSLLIIFTTISTWGFALLTEKNTHHRKVHLIAALILNLSILFTFKYYEFFCSLFEDGLSLIGITIHHHRLGWILPVGISFYTFQSIGYIVDVYKQKVRAERDLCIYALFISFFPQLVAGPIERADNLLPQFKTEKKFQFETFQQGLIWALWGFFLKLCLGDRCGIYVDAIYGNLAQHNGGSYLLASLLFAFQIYSDFWGYSLIAIGTAKMLGYNMTRNFHHPYLSVSISEFWKRWHISLSLWFRDYVYIIIGGSHCSRFSNYVNIIVTMLISGLWHGAALHYVVWGFLHGVAICIEKFLGIQKSRSLGLMYIVRQIVTFGVVTFIWIFFRAETLADAFTVITGIILNPGVPFRQVSLFGAIAVALMIVFFQEIVCEKGYSFQFLKKKNLKTVFVYCYSICIICYILLFGVLKGDQFIYFQF